MVWWVQAKTRDRILKEVVKWNSQPRPSTRTNPRRSFSEFGKRDKTSCRQWNPEMNETSSSYALSTSLDKTSTPIKNFFYNQPNDPSNIMSDLEILNRIEHRFVGRNSSGRNRRMNCLGWESAVISLLAVFALLGWQYRASLGVLEASGQYLMISSGLGQPQPPPSGNNKRPLPGSILSADNGFVLRPLPAPQSSPSNATIKSSKTKPWKKVLYATKFWNHDDFLFGQGSDVFADCPVSQCWATRHHEAVASLDEFDAILVHALDLSPALLAAMRQWRAPHHRFVLVYMESPLYNPKAMEPLDQFFHWTMTYLWNSDIARPYGYFVPRYNTQQHANYHYAHLPAAWIPYNETQFRQRLEQQSQAFLARARRPYQVAWLVSNCGTPSRREDYVQELAKHMNVTIFGRCHNITGNAQPCDDDACYARIQRDYKFVLGFENADCHDYITEKFFGRVHDFVVIVRGRQDNYRRLAPSHSYIHADEYAHPRDLAAYLQSMDDATYLSYFWWQDYYRVEAAPGNGKDIPARRRFFGQSMCRLCERLHLEDKVHQETSMYANLTEWFTSQGQCANSGDDLDTR